MMFELKVDMMWYFSEKNCTDANYFFNRLLLTTQKVYKSLHSSVFKNFVEL